MTLNPTRNIDPINILMVGDYGVGKSSIANRYGKDSFSHEYRDSAEVPSVKEVNIKGKQYRLQIFQPYYHRTQFCKKHAVILTYDVTDQLSYNNILPYMQEIDRYAHENITRILVGNKIDLNDKKVIDFATAKEFADNHNIPFYEVCAKNGTNIDKLFEDTVRYTLNLPKTEPEHKILPSTQPKSPLFDYSKMKKRLEITCIAFAALAFVGTFFLGLSGFQGISGLDHLFRTPLGYGLFAGTAALTLITGLTALGIHYHRKQHSL